MKFEKMNMIQNIKNLPSKPIFYYPLFFLYFGMGHFDLGIDSQ